MKQQAAQKKAVQTKARRPTVQTHERQAKDAAARLLNGEQDLNRLLTQTPAAPRVPVHDCRTRPERLPDKVLAVLEEGFNADLGRMRVYHDAAAARLAAAEGARAFTSGPDIFFAADEYRPGTTEGLRLLAHETAHVLQQTGRMNPDGVMTATAHYGSGELQFDIAWSRLRQAYQQSVEAESAAVQDSMTAMIAEIETLVGAGATLSTELGRGVMVERRRGGRTERVNNLTVFESRVTSGEFNSSERPARSLLFDALKALGRYQGAAALLEHDPSLPTALPDTDFLEFLQTDRNYGLDWFAAIFSRIEGIRELYPDRYLENIYRYLMNPVRGAVSSADIRTAVNNFATQFLRRQREGAFDLENERVRGAWGALRLINESLQTDLRGLERTGLDLAPTTRRRLAAGTILAAARRWETHELRIFRSLSTPTASVAQQALDFWTESELRQAQQAEAAHFLFRRLFEAPGRESARRRTGARAAGRVGTAPTPPELLQIPAEVQSNRVYAGFLRRVKSELGNVLGGDPPVLLEPSAYGRALVRLQSVLNEQRLALGNELFRQFRRGDAGDPAKLERALWFGMAQFFIDGVISVIDEYNAALDRRFINEYDGLPDVRLRNRYRLARYAYQLGAMTSAAVPAARGAVNIQDIAARVLTGGDVGQSYLAFTGDWYDQNANPEHLETDFVPTEPVEGWGLNVNQIRRIFYLLHERALVNALRRILRAIEGRRDPLAAETYGIIQNALRAAREEVPVPRRWAPRDYVLVWNSIDCEVTERAHMAELIRNHPRFDELLRLENHATEAHIIPNFRASRPYVWFLPNFQRLVNYVYNITPVRAGLQTRTTETITPYNLLEYLNSQAILDSELDAAEQRRRRDPNADIVTFFDELMAQLNAALGTDISAIESRRQVLLTQARIHDRRVIENQSRAHLEAYAADSSISNYALPSRVITLIERYRQDIATEAHPPPGVLAERAAHMAALVLKLAGNMRAAFVRPLGFIFEGIEVEDRYDIVTNFFGYIMEALAFLRRDNARELLQRVLHSSESVEEVIAGRTPLEELRRHFIEVIHRLQARFGFRTNDAGTELRRLETERPIAVSDTLIIDGVSYRLIRIHQPFIFHDSYGHGTPAYQPSILKSISRTEYTREQRSRNFPLLTLEILSGAEGAEETGSIAEPAAAPASPTAEAGAAGEQTRAGGATSATGGRTLTLTSSMARPNEVMLEKLAHAVTMESIRRGLVAAAEAIELFFRGGLEAAKIAAMFFPPAGPIIVMIADFAEFLITELPRIRTEILEEPMRVVEELQEFVSPEMRSRMLERLWEYLLFEGDIPFLEQIQARLARPAAAARRRSSPRRAGVMGRLAHFAGDTGRRILQAFLGLRQRSRARFISAHRMVERRPRVNRFLRAIPGILEMGSMVRARDLETAREILGDLLEGNIQENISNPLREALIELFEGLNGLEIPGEILPLDLVLEFLLDRFLMVLGTRGRLVRRFIDNGVEIARRVGVDFDPRRELARVLATQLREQGLDPNILWQEYLQVQLQTMLIGARTDMINGINALFSDLFGTLIQVDASDLPDLTVAIERERVELGAEPALEPMLARKRGEEDEEEAEALPGRPPEVTAAGGVPLPTPQRLRYEGAFGHDFTHVRLHHDRRSFRVTEYYGAEALTSGSHVFLNEGLSLHNPRTESVLKHELAHVLQQTGARPLTMEHAPDPVMGAAGRGLRREPRREAAADRMARAADFRRVHDDPLTVEGPDELGGLVPIISSDIIQRTIDFLGSERVAESFRQQVETLVSIPASIATQRRGEFTAAVDEARRIWNATRTKLQVTTAVTNPRHHGPQTFNNPTARRVISHYFSSYREITEPRLRALTFYSYRIRGNRLRLNADSFKQNLANYISESTGFDIVIDPTGRTVDFVKVMNIDLGEVHGNTRVYQEMKRQTNTRIQRGRPPIPGVHARFTDLEWAKIRVEIIGGGTDVPIWDSEEYRLSDAFIRRMREMLDAVAGGSVDTWENYTTTTEVSNATFGGLRVGTHGQLTGRPVREEHLQPVSGEGAGMMSGPARAGRQSHHIPQYLLIQYLQNLPSASTKIAHEEGGRTLFPPGFSVTGNTATGFSGANRTLDFAGLDPGSSTRDRGLRLPAISLAAKTHQKGQLHINAATTWGSFTEAEPSIETTGSHTQGVLLDRKFYGFLRGRMSPRPPEDKLSILRQANLQPSANHAAVFEAIRDSYMWMFRDMMRALRRTLNRDVNDREHWEAVSYRMFALNRPQTQTAPGVLKPEYTPHNTQLTSVANAIEEKNRQIMADWYRG